MAKVTLTIEDTESGLLVNVESDPPLPIARVTDPRWLAELGGEGQDLDMEKATTAQAAARMAVGELLDASAASRLVVRSSRVRP